MFAIGDSDVRNFLKKIRIGANFIQLFGMLGYSGDFKTLLYLYNAVFLKLKAPTLSFKKKNLTKNNVSRGVLNRGNYRVNYQISSGQTS